jgi:predicted ATPase
MERLTVQRFVLTGAPGSGKTSVLRALRDRGYAVVSEAVTDVISAGQSQGTDQPWRDPLLTGRIVRLQRLRQLQPVPAGTRVQIYDRSPLAEWRAHGTDAR